MSRRALVVGINHYVDESLPCLGACVNDANAVAAMLRSHHDGSPNYDVRLLAADGEPSITRATLRAEWQELFDFDGEVLFYFAGHGFPSTLGGYLMTSEATLDDPGPSMLELLTHANAARVRRPRSVVLILDCCHSGHLGGTPFGGDASADTIQIRDGVTILAASGATEASMEEGQHGAFTALLLNAMDGAAADPLGRVSPASAYAMIESAFGPWDQRPLYRTSTNEMNVLRRCAAEVDHESLRRLRVHFKKPDSMHRMDPSYERTSRKRTLENVATFELFMKLRNARLLRAFARRSTREISLYDAAMGHGVARLTPLGQHYWRLVAEGRL